MRAQAAPSTGDTARRRTAPVLPADVGKLRRDGVGAGRGARGAAGSGQLLLPATLCRSGAGPGASETLARAAYYSDGKKAAKARAMRPPLRTLGRRLLARACTRCCR